MSNPSPSAFRRISPDLGEILNLDFDILIMAHGEIVAKEAKKVFRQAVARHLI